MSGVRVVRTGTANLASVVAGLRRVDAEPVLCADPDLLAKADRVVLPGVGALAAAMETLRGGLGDALAARIRAGRPTLAICLGMQLLLEGSDESPGVAGLGVVAGHAHKFIGVGLRVPHLGWNRVEPGADCRLLRPGHAYFAHSFYLAEAPVGWAAARTTHGAAYVSAFERGPVLACQFHPELSGAWGLDLLRRWLEA